MTAIRPATPIAETTSISVQATKIFASRPPMHSTSLVIGTGDHRRATVVVTVSTLAVARGVLLLPTNVQSCALLARRLQNNWTEWAMAQLSSYR